MNPVEAVAQAIEAELEHNGLDDMGFDVDHAAAAVLASLKPLIEDPLWELLQRWYQIAANEMVASDTQHGYRECANQLDDLLARWVSSWTSGSEG